MKKLILAILCLFLSSTLWAAEPVQLSRLITVGAGVSAGASCQANPFAENTTTDNAASFGRYETSYAAGGSITPAATKTICKIGILMGIDGNPSALEYVVKIWVNADPLATIITNGTSPHSHLIAAGWVYFDYVSMPTLTASTVYAFTVDHGGLDAVNYGTFYYDTEEGAGFTGGWYKWNSSYAAQAGNATQNVAVRFYSYE